MGPKKIHGLKKKASISTLKKSEAISKQHLIRLEKVIQAFLSILASIKNVS
jgi:hypothetical protein